MKKVDALNKQHYDSDEEWDGELGMDGQPLMNQGLSLNWKSLFGTLTNGDNEDALETYLKCSNSYQTSGQRGASSSSSSKCIRDCSTEWERAEFAWLKVEKRLRCILLQALGDKEGGGKEARAFVTAVEELLLSLEKEREMERQGEREGGDGDDAGGEGTALPTAAAMAHLFPRPPRLVRPSCPALSRDDSSSSLDSEGVVILGVAAPHLVVTLLESPFHRLLLHATCQFHNMHSKSYTVKSSKSKSKSKGKKLSSSGAESVRATRISPFQSQQGAHSISLVPFVLLQLASPEEDKDTEREKGGRAAALRGKRNDSKHKASAQTDKENSPKNSQRCTSTTSTSIYQQGDASDDSCRELKQQQQEEEDNKAKKEEVVEEAVVSLEDLMLEDNDDADDDEDEDDEYCLVDIVSSSAGSHSNPIESREGS